MKTYIKRFLTLSVLGVSLFCLLPGNVYATEQDDVMDRMERSNKDFDKKSEEMRRSFDQTVNSYSNGSVANSKLAEKQKSEIERQFNESKSSLSGNKDVTRSMPSQRRADLTRGFDTNINNTDRDLMRLQNNANNSSLYSDAELDQGDRFSDMSGGAQIDNERDTLSRNNREAATLVMDGQDSGDDYSNRRDSRERPVGEIVTDEGSNKGGIVNLDNNELLKYLLIVVVVFVVMAVLYFNGRRRSDEE